MSPGLTLAPGRRARGAVQLPGSKSLSNRLLLLASMCSQPTELPGLLQADDVQVCQAALRELGHQVDGHRVCPGVWKSKATLWLGNAGTAVRPLVAILSGQTGVFELDGEPRMRERPLGPLLDALRRWGAEIEELGQTGFLPLRIHGRTLKGGPNWVDASLSSQYASALLMAAPRFLGPSQLELRGQVVSRPYIDLTLAQMQLFGVKVTDLAVPSQAYQSPGLVYVEGDATAASYFLAAGALGGGPVRILGAGSTSLQSELRFAHYLEQMGAHLKWGPDWVEVSQGRGPLRGISCDLNELPDAAMTLAVVALFAEGVTEIRGVANWTIKECDRQDALFCELTKVGAHVEKLPDGIRIVPPQDWRPATVETYQDHRMAMCFSLLTFSPVQVHLLDPGCVSKTYPGYFQDLDSILC
jgi:3-phosphoshikimate 1-carboxyvinyltransferase